jgi:hypothetical protein
LHIGHDLADERNKSGTFCRDIELPRVRVSRLYFLLSLHGANGGLGSPYVYFTDIDVFDTLQSIICWSLLLIRCDHIANVRIPRPELAQTR